MGVVYVNQDLLKFCISIGSTVIQDVENGIVNIGISAQQNVMKSEMNGAHGLDSKEKGKST